MFPLKRILCPTDLTADSHHAMQYAGEMARHFSADLTVLHVYVPSQPAVWPYEGLGINPYIESLSREESLELRNKKLEQEAANIFEEELAPRLLMLEGDPAQVILSVAEQYEAEMIVIAPHQHSRIRKALLSTTTEEVVKNAPCPVIMMPARQLAEERSMSGAGHSDEA